MADRDFDASEQLLDQVRQALADDRPLCIQGSDSKAFLGRIGAGERLDTRVHCGIVSYDPTELVITARAGTPLQTLRAAVEQAGQMLPFEPPAYGEQATLGGTVAAGLSGPRRPWAGSARDYVLGTRVITGQGKHLRFGGEVMKNVAGYDLSRLLTGSFGTLGVLTEVSLKVLPKPRACFSIKLACDAERALLKLAEWGQQPMPISAACHSDEALYLRLEGGEGSVAAAHERIGGEPIDSAFWDDLNEHRLPFFAQPEPLCDEHYLRKCPDCDEWFGADENAENLGEVVPADSVSGRSIAGCRERSHTSGALRVFASLALCRCRMTLRRRCSGQLWTLWGF
ncbi:MAG: glycolate oxidase subunit GlcE, partial [Proteobacteria bacterium]